MPRAHESTAQQDKQDSELANGRGSGWQGVYHMCPQDGCYFGSRVAATTRDHERAPHRQCTVSGCQGSYSAMQKECHMFKSHGIRAPRTQKQLECRHSGCVWSCDSQDVMAKHEDEPHVACLFRGCDYRCSRQEYLKHERIDHDPLTDLQSKMSIT